ncbi:MAG: DUF1439 domain-containing protein [Betaproteobacteria bacterium]|nr:DUF1439 domain-containing protein [Betaproteobacteria bacterium]MCH9849600.1 DUF1439 domain-containing protein [Betaproteobacteria bacterium]
MGDRTVNVTSAQIQEKLNEKLSVPFSLLKVFDVKLSNALVTFDQTTGRMHTVMDADLSSKLLNQQSSGKLGLSGKLRFDAASSSVLLDEPAIEQINLGQASQQYNEILNALAKTVGKEMLKGLTLYKVKPDDLKVSGTQYVPKGIVVTDRGLQIKLSPQ